MQRQVFSIYSIIPVYSIISIKTPFYLEIISTRYTLFKKKKKR